MSSHPSTPWGETDGGARWSAGAGDGRGGDAYAKLIRIQRLLQDRVAGAVLPAELIGPVTQQLADVAELLESHQAGEDTRWAGWRPDLPGRALPLLPPYLYDEEGSDKLVGRVTFTRFYLGGNGAVHGGSHSLLFDDVMGHLANKQPGVSRTAYLTVNYRRITPIDVELTYDVTLERVDGRKTFVSARLRDPADAVLADAEGLWLRLLPGQQ